MFSPELHSGTATRKIVFLDIDGVLQPFGTNNRFQYDMDEEVDKLCRQFNTDIYRHMDKYDVTAVKFDWDGEAVSLLKGILDATSAEIVLETSWAIYNSFDEMKALFRIWELDSHVTDVIPEPRRKDAGITQYVELYGSNITSYCIIDDVPIFDDMSRQVKTHYKLGPAEAASAIAILNG